jgi:single-strand DNA-binding protein
MNQNNFIGNLGNDPELRDAGSAKVVNVNMAVTEKYKGEKKTTWVPLTFWNKTAELVSQYCKKGAKLRVTAKFEMQDWQDKDGNKRQSPKFNVIDMEFLGGGQSQQSGQQSQQQNQYQSPPNQQPQQQQTAPPQQNIPNDDFMEDD